MAFLSLLAGAMLVALVMVSGIGLITWLFPTPRANTGRKKTAVKNIR